MTFNLNGSVNQEFNFIEIDIFYEFMTTELLINKDVSKTDQALNDE
jgi:hypothetical protein